MNNKNLDKSAYSDISVLLFGCGGRQALPMTRGFFKLGCKVIAYCESKLDTGYLTRFVTKRILYDKNNEFNEGFFEYGLRLIKSGEYDLVVPLGDTGATILSQHKNELLPYAKIAVNDWEVFQNVIDKAKTMEICEESNIPAPKTIFSNDPVMEIRNKGLSYPIVVKPKTACGSIGFNIINDEKTLINYLEGYDNVYGPILIQEYIPQNGSQFGGEVFCDHNGNIISLVIDEKPRWFPIDGGSPTINISIHNDEMARICKELVSKIKWCGYANVDMLVDSRDNRPKIIEVNGRISAAVKLNYSVCIDIAELIIRNEFNMPMEPITNYPDNKQISCFLSDLLWFIKSKDRFSATPSWFSRWHASDAIFSWDDPIPSIGFVITSIKSFRVSMEKRKRFNS